MSSLGPFTLKLQIDDFESFVSSNDVSVESAVSSNRGFQWKIIASKRHTQLAVTVGCRTARPNDGQWTYGASLKHVMKIINATEIGERANLEDKQCFSCYGDQWALSNSGYGHDLGYISFIQMYLEDGGTVLVETTVAPGIPNNVRELLSLNTERHPSDNVSFRVGADLIHANKEYLSAISPVFATMFSGDFAEKEADEIQMDDMDPKDFLAFVSALRILDYPANDGNVLAIAKLAERFDVQPLLNKCLNFLESDQCKLPILEKFYFALEWNFEFYKREITSKLTKRDISWIRRDERYKELAKEVVDDLLAKCIQL